MPRRFANQVHLTASRLLKERYIDKAPAWYNAVLEFPPIPLPPRGTPSRSQLDSRPSEAAKRVSFRTHTPPKPKPDQVIYKLHDKVRQQFFRDHPFEAFNPRSLLEGAEIEPLHRVNGANWTRLRQHGRNPTSEDAVKFAVNLHEHHAMPLSQAYHTAVIQFRALRSEFLISSAVAAREAEAYGAVFASTELDRGFRKEGEALETFTPEAQGAAAYSGKLPWSSVWKMPGAPQADEGWTRGQAYTERLQQGIRPNYSPDFTGEELVAAAKALEGMAPLAETPQEVQERQKFERHAHRKEQSDIMGLVGR